MLGFFITCLPDRYDHHTRLLPYVLSFFNDDREMTRKMALQSIEHCGGQYEAEHPDDVIERRQVRRERGAKRRSGNILISFIIQF
jgi:hypothetical protein